jgi:hypothetical protein
MYVKIIVDYNELVGGWEVVGLDESKVGDILNDKPFTTKEEAQAWLDEYEEGKPEHLQFGRQAAQYKFTATKVKKE